jgi:hypothetical protein
MAFVGLAIIAIAIAGEPPKADATAADILSYFTEKRSQVLESSAVWFVAAILLLSFLGVLRSHVRGTDGGDRLSATAFGGGIFGVAFLTASFCGFNAAALEIARTVAAGAVQLLYALGLMASHGPLANGGSLGVLEPLFSMCWFAAVSVALFRKPRPKTVV